MIVVTPFAGDQSDMDKIAALHLEIRQWQESAGQNKFADIYDSQKDLTNLQEFYIESGGNFFVARNNETSELVGFVALKNDSNGRGEVKRLAVKPAYQRQRIATRLTDELMNWARVNGFAKFTLSTNRDEHAMAIYQRLGFEIVGYDETNEDHLMKLEWEDGAE